MSGICGIVLTNSSEKLDSSCLGPMTQALGFDRNGQFENVCTGSVGFGICRTGGYLSQVFRKNVHGAECCIAVHGSFFGLYASNRDERGAVAAQLIENYLDLGIDFLTRIHGEFAIALWDGRSGTLHLATDRFRVHPVFYYQDGQKLLFASRLKSITACSMPVRRTVDPRSVVDIMAFSAITTPNTIYREVRKLPPGAVLTFRDGLVNLSTYWDVDALHPDSSSEFVLATEMKKHFTNSIETRWEYDKTKNVGAFLSGGIDSSTVVGVLTQVSAQPAKCFSIGFEDQRFNEMTYARLVAKHFRAQHYEYTVTAKDTQEAIPILMEAFDEPFANASAVPTLYCAKLARAQGIDVLYAGDGGDELFGGNERYSFQRLFDYYADLPAVVRKTLIVPFVDLAASLTGLALAAKAQKYIRRASIPYPQRLTSYGLFNVIPMAELFHDDILEAIGSDYEPYAPIHWHYHNAQAKTALDRQLYIDLKVTISDNDLFKVTRMTEAVGVTARFPFLDHLLAEYAMQVPASIKMPGRELRKFFKQAYANLLPPEVLTKTKHGFGLPIPVWLRTDRALNEMMHELVLSPRSVQRGYFRKRTLELLLDRHKHEEGSFYGDILWNVMVWEQWFRLHWDSAENI